MTTSMCQRPKITLPVLDAPGNPEGITGPRDISAVRMLRISVTDLCNLRCVYCMPAEGMDFMEKHGRLSYDEIVLVARAAAALGTTHLKLTGGEPTTRRDLPELVGMLREIAGIRDISLTTNGILLAGLLAPLRAAGLDRITLSMDSLDPERFSAITRGGSLQRVMAALEQACAMDFKRIKVNVVVMRGTNDDEIPAFVDLARRLDITVRFIEYMPLGRSKLTDNPEAAMVSEAEIRAAIEGGNGPDALRLRPLSAASDGGVGPATLWEIPGSAGRIGFISAMSKPFCATCNRLRLTADGLLRSCLFDGGEVDIGPILRPADRTAQPDDAQTLTALRNALTQCVALKPETHSYRGNKAMSRIGG